MLSVPLATKLPLPLTEVSSLTDATVGLPITAASLTAVTLTVTVAGAESLPLASETIYVITAVPLKFATGVNSNFPSTICTTPCDEVADLSVSTSPSRSWSLARTSTTTFVSSRVVVTSSKTRGTLFTARISSIASCCALFKSPVVAAEAITSATAPA